ncbi:MAG: hypothetical protein IJJ61_05545 [Clostridia bacterium]|nr:hypothetical protein [Clostridia bacterium]MBQ6467390.1 hypothetical protein [Clostridia bacterium]
MKLIKEYNPVILPTYRYATFPCDIFFENINFDNILKEIGKHYFHNPEAGLNTICSLIRDEINIKWRLNGFKTRARMKRVSTNQIKTIRHSFIKATNNKEKFIRIPFDAVSILFFIIKMLNSIEKNNPSVEAHIKAMDNETIGDYSYSKHIEIFNDNIDRRLNQLTDAELIDKYKSLRANLTGQYSIMLKNHSEVNWENDDEYRIK